MFFVGLSFFGPCSLSFRRNYTCLQFPDKYFLNNKHSIFIAYRRITRFLARGVFNVPFVKSFSIRLR